MTLLRLLSPALATLLLVACPGGDVLEPPQPTAEATPEPAPRPTRIEAIESPAADGARFPVLQESPDGDVIVTWLRSTETGATLEFARMLEDGTFGPPHTVVEHERMLVSWADGGSIQLGRDHWVAHWPQSVDGGYHSYVSRSSDDGATWSPGVRLHDFDGPGEYGFVATLPRDDGTTLFAWLDGRKWADDSVPDETAIMTRIMDADAILGPEAVLDARVCDCCPTSHAVTETGAIVAYRDRTAAEVRDISVLAHDGAEWGEPVIPSVDGWTIAGCPVNGPSVVSHEGSTLLTWTTSADDRSRVQSIRLDADGNGRSDPFLIAEGDGVIGRVDSLIRDDGALVTWIERVDDEAIFRGRWLRPDDVLAETFDISVLPAGRASGTPRVLDGPTGILVVWTKPSDPSTIGVGILR